LVSDWNKAVKKKFGFHPDHLNLSHGLWIMESWNQDQYPELAINDKNILSKIDKMHEEAVAKKHREGPLTQEVIAGKNHFLSADSRIGKCILTSVGMTEMAQRSTGESSTTNAFHAIGSGTTTETLADTTLETELAIKAIGTSQVVSQTERYGTSFVSTDLTSPPQDITEAGIFTLISSGVLIMRITATATELSTGIIITVQTNVTHQNGTEV